MRKKTTRRSSGSSRPQNLRDNITLAESLRDLNEASASLKIAQDDFAAKLKRVIRNTPNHNGRTTIIVRGKVCPLTRDWVAVRPGSILYWWDNRRDVAIEIEVADFRMGLHAGSGGAEYTVQFANEGGWGWVSTLYASKMACEHHGPLERD